MFLVHLGHQPLTFLRQRNELIHWWLMALSSPLRGSSVSVLRELARPSAPTSRSVALEDVTVGFCSTSSTAALSDLGPLAARAASRDTSLTSLLACVNFQPIAHPLHRKSLHEVPSHLDRSLPFQKQHLPQPLLPDHLLSTTLGWSPGGCGC